MLKAYPESCLHLPDYHFSYSFPKILERQPPRIIINQLIGSRVDVKKRLRHKKHLIDKHQRTVWRIKVFTHFEAPKSRQRGLQLFHAILLFQCLPRNSFCDSQNPLPALGAMHANDADAQQSNVKKRSQQTIHFHTEATQTIFDSPPLISRLLISFILNIKLYHLQ